MTRRASVLFSCVLACLAAPLLSPLDAQVGHPPSRSPYEDLRGRHVVSIAPGMFVTGGDPAGVAPRSGLMISGRYEYLLTGPLWLVTRAAYAPGLDRTVKDPEGVPAARIVGTDTDPLFLLDAGFGLNLTGNKSWKRLVPRVTGSFGMVSTFNSSYDLGGYRFGTKLIVSYGVGTRIVTGSKWEMSADITHMFWKMKYPDNYGGDGSATDRSILGSGKLGPWKGNLLLSVGISHYFFR